MASQPQSGEKEVCLTLGMVRQWRENATKGQFLCIDAEKETCAAAEKPTMVYKSCQEVSGLHNICQTGYYLPVTGKLRLNLCTHEKVDWIRIAASGKFSPRPNQTFIANRAIISPNIPPAIPLL